MNQTTSSGLDQLTWMQGPCQGKLDVRTVTEDWQRPFPDSMQTMVRLSTETEIQVLEMIVIREVEDSLVLHLRQFTPDLTLFTNLDMSLHELTEQSVSFVTDGTGITGLAYTRIAETEMRVDVTIASGDVLSATLNRAT